MIDMILNAVRLILKNKRAQLQPLVLKLRLTICKPHINTKIRL